MIKNVFSEKALKQKTFIDTISFKFITILLVKLPKSNKYIIYMKVDYIIVGQGLAGSLIAYELLKRNRKILVYDLPEENQSSSVAAGLFNPVTGRRFVKTWKADVLFPFLHNF